MFAQPPLAMFTFAVATMALDVASRKSSEYPGVGAEICPKLLPSTTNRLPAVPLPVSPPLMALIAGVVEPRNAAAATPSPVGPMTRRSNGPPERPDGTTAVRRSVPCQRTSFSSVVPRKARNVASTRTAPPQPISSVAVGSKWSPTMTTGRSPAPVYAADGCTPCGCGAGRVEPRAQAAAIAQSARVLEQLKAVPQAERERAKRTVQEGKDACVKRHAVSVPPARGPAAGGTQPRGGRPRQSKNSFVDSRMALSCAAISGNQGKRTPVWGTVTKRHRPTT